jgi:hypothetical protein
VRFKKDRKYYGALHLYSFCIAFAATNISRLCRCWFVVMLLLLPIFRGSDAVGLLDCNCRYKCFAAVPLLF